MFQELLCLIQSEVLIETLWNVNAHVERNEIVHYNVLIETLWNVNTDALM